jgi:hypothetical protein
MDHTKTGQICEVLNGPILECLVPAEIDYVFNIAD